MLIRNIEIKDIPECSEIFKTVFSSPPWDENWTLDSALNRISHFYNTPNSVGTIAVNNSKIIGFTLGNIEPFCYENIFYLREMCVLSNKQNKGIGKRLIHTLEENVKALGVNKVFLSTHKNTPAENFYLSCGYDLIRHYHFYVKPI